jgi:hypothetical protein
MKFNRRHGEFEQECVLSESYTATDALRPILPACHQPLLPACVFVTRDTVRHPRRVCSENLFVMKGVHEQRFHWYIHTTHMNCEWQFAMLCSVICAVFLSIAWVSMLMMTNVAGFANSMGFKLRTWWRRSTYRAVQTAVSVPHCTWKCVHCVLFHVSAAWDS